MTITQRVDYSDKGYRKLRGPIATILACSLCSFIVQRKAGHRTLYEMAAAHAIMRAHVKSHNSEIAPKVTGTAIMPPNGSKYRVSGT